MVSEDYFSTHYKEYVGDLEKYYERQTAYYERHFSFLSGLNKSAGILDLGCGVGNFIAYLEKKRFKCVKGVDTSGESVKVCRRQYPEFVFEQISIDEFLKNTSDVFSIISMFSTLEHIPKKQIVPILSSIKDRLKPGEGRFIFSTPNMGALFGNTAGRYNDFTHTAGYTESSLKQILKMAGFTEIQIWGSCPECETPLQWFVYKVYQPVMFQIVKLFLRSMGLDYPRIPGYVLHGCAMGSGEID